MGHLFRINKGATGTNSTIVDWSNSPRSTYDHGFVDKIEDSTTTQNEITSIPSPFARIDAPVSQPAFLPIISTIVTSPLLYSRQ